MSSRARFSSREDNHLIAFENERFVVHASVVVLLWFW
jgi:hypothetical protein